MTYFRSMVRSMMSLSKNFLRASAFAAMLLVPFSGNSANFSHLPKSGKEKRLSFFNTHTKVNLDVEYWRQGQYDENSLDRVNHFLRDHRNGHVHEIDPELMDLLYDIKTELESRHKDLSVKFHVISGFRSAQTNEKLRKAGGGQAKNSRHVMGKAIDIRVPGVSTKELRNVAWCMQQGGVGYYKNSDFVHVDTDRVRFWNWSPSGLTCPVPQS